MDVNQFKQFALAFGIRRSKKQKAVFKDNLKSVFANYGYSMTIYEEKMGLRKLEHLVFGDLSKAHVIYVVGYDTTEKLILGNGQYWPLEEDRNRSKIFVNLLITLILSLLIAVCSIYGITYALKLSGWRMIVMIIACVGLIYVANRTSQGITNRATFSKTSSIFLLFELLRKSQNKNNAFIFLDYGSFSKIGINFINKEGLLSEKQTCVYLDCFSDGDTLLLAYDKKSKGLAKQMADNYTGPKKLVSLDKAKSNRFEDLKNIVILSNTFIDEKDKSLYVSAVRTDEDLTIDPVTINLTVDMLLRTEEVE